MSSHSKVLSHLKNVCNSTVTLIGAGLTGDQPADVNWNKPFKLLYTEKYDEWVQNNDGSPPKSLIVKWVVEAWKDLSPDIIFKSFKTCGIAIATENSENELVNACRKYLAARLDTYFLQKRKMMKEDSLDDEETIQWSLNMTLKRKFTSINFK